MVRMHCFSITRLGAVLLRGWWSGHAGPLFHKCGMALGNGRFSKTGCALHGNLLAFPLYLHTWSKSSPFCYWRSNDENSRQIIT